MPDLFFLKGIWIAVLITLALWSAVWKGFALWRAGRNNDPGWFIVMCIFNTAGILEILYLFVFSKRKSA